MARTETAEGKPRTGWDPGYPIPDEAIRFTLNGTTVITAAIEARSWYWLYVPSASDVYLKLGAAAATIDRTKNMPVPPGMLIPVYTLDAVLAGIVADATAAGYAWLIKVGGDDAAS